MVDRTFRTEFPDFPAEDIPPMPIGFVDESWHNDTCPCFVEPKEGGLRVYVDYIDPAKREFPEAPRFSLILKDEHILDTDSWADVLARIAIIRG